VKYAWIEEHNNRFPVRMMCKVLGVSRNGYYHWYRHKTKQEDQTLIKTIEEIFEASEKTYGTRRIKATLSNKYGWIVSRRRIGRILKSKGLKAKTKQSFKVKTTDSNHNLSISPNLLQQEFYASSPNEIYVGDITYIKTNEGWIYLAVVIDLYSRSVVGYAVAEHMEASLVCDALSKANNRRGGIKQNAIFHSDRGSQYASQAFRDLLENLGMRQSMSAKGNCYDNAACESFFGTLKTELDPTHNQSKKEVVVSIKNYIWFYNTKRLHSFNNYLSPLEVELKWWQNRFRDSV